MSFVGEKALKYPGLSVQLRLLSLRDAGGDRKKAQKLIEVTTADEMERSKFVKLERTGRINIKKQQGKEIVKRGPGPLERAWTSTGRQGGSRHFPPEKIQGRKLTLVVCRISCYKKMSIRGLGTDDWL